MTSDNRTSGASPACDVVTGLVTRDVLVEAARELLANPPRGPRR